MTMHIGPDPESSSDEDDVLMDINTTPLIDVMLVLLVMLIITIPIQTHAVKIELPISTPPYQSIPPQVVTLDVEIDGTVLWNGQIVPNHLGLEQKLSDAARMVDQPEIHLRPNKLTTYGHVAAVMAPVQRLGLTKVGIVGSEQFFE